MVKAFDTENTTAMGDKNNKKVIVAYTGDLMPINIQLHGATFPLLRIEAVFSKRKHFDKWVERFQHNYEHTLLYSMKLPLNPEYGDKEKGMKPYFLKTDENFEILEIQEIENLDKDDPRFEGNVVQAKPGVNGEFTVTCWARDEFDACRLAIIELREATTKFDFDMEVDPTIVANFTVHMPTNPVVSFELPGMVKIPEIGQIFELKFEHFIIDPEEWELAKSTLANDVMVVDRIENNNVYLREGNPD